MAEAFKTMVDIFGQINMDIRSEKQDEQTLSTFSIAYKYDVNKNSENLQLTNWKRFHKLIFPFLRIIMRETFYGSFLEILAFRTTIEDQTCIPDFCRALKNGTTLPDPDQIEFDFDNSLLILI